MPGGQTQFDLSGRVAIITGGSRGLGAGMAGTLAAAGARVVAVARKEPELNAAVAELQAAGGEALAVAGDVSNPETGRRAVQAALDRWGRLDILINNAGVTWGAPFEEMPLDRWEYVLRVNLTGTFLMTQAAARVMLPQRSGRIINVVSGESLGGSDPEIMPAAGYLASKGGLITLTRHLARCWADRGVLVNAIAPGWFPTRMSQGVIRARGELITSRVPMGRVGEPGELNGTVLLLASDAGSYITGQVIAVDGGITA